MARVDRQCDPCAVAAVTTRHRLLGSWRLLSWTISDPAGVRTPFGATPKGTLLYTPDGGMAAAVCTADRPVLSAASPRQASSEEAKAAFVSFFCYTGRWHLDSDHVVHSVELALNPGMVGTEQRRRVVWQDEVLALTADEPVGADVRHHELRWRRTA